MTRGVAAAVAGTLLALLATLAWVPTRSEWGTGPVEYRWCWDREPDDVRLFRRLGVVVTGLDWRREDGSLVNVVPVSARGAPLLRPVAWPVVVVEQVGVLVLGGGLLSFLVRRARRRQAGTPA